MNDCSRCDKPLYMVDEVKPIHWHCLAWDEKIAMDMWKDWEKAQEYLRRVYEATQVP